MKRNIKELLEIRKQIRENRETYNENYILKKINTLIKIEKIEELENISKDNYEKILSLIEEDFYKEKNEIIKNIISKNDKKRFKHFRNKERYLEKKFNYYTKTINIIEESIKKYKNIENNYVSYYCDNIIKNYIHFSNIKKEQKLLIGWIFIKLGVLEKKYNDITKTLAYYTKNNEYLKKIRDYEDIKRKSDMNRINQQIALTNALSKNIKELTLKADDIIGNGFFGL